MYSNKSGMKLSISNIISFSNEYLEVEGCSNDEIDQINNDIDFEISKFIFPFCR